MPRVKGGYVTRRRRNRILKLAKGYFGSKHTLYKTAKQQVMKSLTYAYRDRKVNKRNFRKLWIARINAAARLNGLSYSKLMYGLKLNNVEVNRKMLSEIAISNPAEFAKLCELAKKPVEKHFSDIKDAQIKASNEEKAAEAARKAKVAEAREARKAAR